MTNHIIIFDTTLRDGEQSLDMAAIAPHRHPRESGGLVATYLDSCLRRNDAEVVA